MTPSNGMLRPKLLALVVAANLLTGCFDKPVTLGDLEKPKVSVTAYQVDSAKQTLAPISNVIGKASFSAVGVQSKISGTVKRVGFVDGQAVKKGDVLFELDEALLKQSMADSEASFQSARKAYRKASKERNRIVGLFMTKGAEKAQFDHADDELKLAHDQYVAALTSRNSDLFALKHTKILAPFDGIPGKPVVEVGDKVSPTLESLVVVTRLKSQWVDFELPALEYKALMASKKPVTWVTLTFTDGVISTATLVAAAPGQDEVVALRADLQEPSSSFIPGDDVQVEIHGFPVVNLISVPKTALRENSDGFYVFVIKDEIVDVRQVSIIRLASGEAFITEGLSPGEQVVTSNFAKIRVGARAQVVGGAGK